MSRIVSGIGAMAGVAGFGVRDTQPVDMTIERTAYSQARVVDSKTGIKLEINGFKPSLWVRGDIDTDISYNNPNNSLNGISIMGGGINTGVRPFGNSFLLTGAYKREDGTDASLNVRMDPFGAPPLRDLIIQGAGLDLVARWTGNGYRLEGEFDKSSYGKRALAIVGAALTGLTWDLFV